MALTREDVTKLYVASFNRAPDAAGLSYWMNDSALTKLQDMATAFMQSAEMTALYPIAQTNTEFVQSMYQNMFGRAADVSGLAYWVERLDNGTLPRESMIQTLINGAIAGTGSAGDADVLNNKTTVGLAYADAGLNDITDATAVMAGVTANDLSVTASLSSIVVLQTEAEAAVAAAAAAAAIAAAEAAANAAAAAEAAGYTFTLTTANDVKTGGTGPDTFNSTFSDGAATSTFNVGDILDGAGGTADTLNISSANVAVMSLTDALWVNKSHIEKVVVNNNAGAGAINFTTGANFNTAFTAGGVELTTAGGAGAITIDMATTPFTGSATIIATSTGAGEHVITTGSGTVTTVASTTLAGAQTVNGTGLTSVDLTSNGAGAQTVGNSGLTDNLTSVTVTQHGAGNQTITSTSATAVTVDVLNDGSAGNQTVTTAGGNDIVNATNIGGTTNVFSTGAGADTITLYASGAATSNTITGGAGNDSITLVANAAPDTLVYAGATVATDGLDTINNFTIANDIFKFIDTDTAILGTATKGYASGLGTALGLGATDLSAANVIVITDTQTQTGAGIQALIATINGGVGTDIGDGVFIISAAAGDATLWYDASAVGGNSVAIATLVGIDLAALASLTTDNFAIA